MGHDPVERLRAICASVGFDLEHAKSSLVDRVRLLAEHTETVADAKRMTVYAERVFRRYEDEKPREAFSDLEKQTVVLGCLFADIGKSGPEHASSEDRRLIAEMFSVEGVRDDTISVHRFFHDYFADAESRVARFEALALDAAMTIRAFWNLHSAWTLDIAEAAGLPREAVAAAASHHLLEDVNPQCIVGHDQRYTREFGKNFAFDRSEKLIILLDKYDAVRRRGKRDHAAAIVWLRDLIAQNPRFCNDAELATLLEDVHQALGNVRFGS